MFYPDHCPEPVHLIDPPEAFRADVSAEENEQKQRDLEDAEISAYLDSLS